MRFFGAEADETPANVFEMLLTHRIVFSTAFHVVDAAVDLNRNACAANGEVHCVSSDLMLAHDMYAFVS